MDLYDDDYATCKETSATLRIKHVDLDPDRITMILGLSPTKSWRKNDPVEGRRRPARVGMWILDSEGHVNSRDLRRHLDWLIKQISDKKTQLINLQQQGYILDVFCHWIQLGGTGGPILSANNMQGLSALGLQIGFEFWSVEDNE